MVNRIEALVDAISYLHKFHQADSLSYRLRNPILLKSYARVGKHAIDENGYRVFDSHLGGYKSAVFDIELKLSGNSNTGLQPADKLRNLLGVLGIKKEEEVLAVVYFLRKAVDKDIDPLTTLSYFTEQ